MKGIVLAGGTGSRLYPLTRNFNKHLLPVGRQPMIYYPIQKLVRAGITEIMIVTGTEHMGQMVACLGSGKDFDCEFTYRVQDESGGIAQALRLAKRFVGNDLACVMLGDNVFSHSIDNIVAQYQQIGSGAMIILKDVCAPGRFGVAFTSAGKVESIIEKPSTDQLNRAATLGKDFYAIIGVYFYDPFVFDVIDTLKPSARNELEISDVNCAYLKNDQLHSYILGGWWTDAGTFDSLRAANEFVHCQESHPMSTKLADLVDAPDYRTVC